MYSHAGSLMYRSYEEKDLGRILGFLEKWKRLFLSAYNMHFTKLRRMNHKPPDFYTRSLKKCQFV